MGPLLRRWALPLLILILLVLLGLSGTAVSFRVQQEHAGAAAAAELAGGPLAPELIGDVEFFDRGTGTLVAVRLRGLPDYASGETPVGPHGFHIHDGGSCEVGDPEDPFQGAQGHFNPTEQPHGNHAGDFPVLFSNGGIAVMRFFTDRFQVEEVLGKTVIVHQNPDDYRTEPSGSSGARLGCGVIEPVEEEAEE